MEDFKSYLSEDPDEAERAGAEQIRSGLEGLRLERKVKEVAATRRALLLHRFRTRIIIAFLLALTGGGAFILEKGSPAPLEQQQQPRAPMPGPADAPPTPARDISPPPPDDSKNRPVVENRPSKNLPEPRFPAPTLRGPDSDDPARTALLNKVWHTDYPPPGFAVSGRFAQADALLKTRDFTGAYVQLQRLERNLPANDTLRFMKGFCLLEMGEGVEALTYLEGLGSRQPAWKMQVEWYRALGLLLSGDTRKARAAFRDIGATPGHTYRQQGMKAAQLLE